MNITLNTSNNPPYESMFNTLTQEVFGFSFQPWFEQKLWNESYESYSVIENGRMLANVCVFKHEMLVRGELVRALQFGAVATAKAARGRGLSRLLMEHVLEIYPGWLAFLNANPGVVDFYPRFGFRQVQTYKPEIAVKIDNAVAGSSGFDMDFVYKRNAYSHIIDYVNAQPVNVFHLVMEYGDDVYFLPALDVFAVAKQSGERLYLADVVAGGCVDFDELVRELPFAGVEVVEFGFCPDWLGVEPEWVVSDMEEELFFVKGDWDLPRRFCFPVMGGT